MSGEKIPLPEVDEVRITLLMDNSIDVLMSGTDVARRFHLGPDAFTRAEPIAEHGYSALVHVQQGQKEGTVLFDTGVSQAGVLHNLDALQVSLADVRAIALSHGHPDHTTGLAGLWGRLGRGRLPLVLHPDVYLERKVALPNGVEIPLPPPHRADLRQENIEVIEEVGPSLLVDGMLLLSGEVPRRTEFERGLPSHYARRDGSWEPDPLVMDDQALIAHVRGKGLVVVTGCGHAGIINIIRHAWELTGVTPVYAVVGGFHLTGRQLAPIIPATVAALKEIGPRYVMPGHCTGWEALHQIATAMPEAFIPSSVGTTLVL